MLDRLRRLFHTPPHFDPRDGAPPPPSRPESASIRSFDPKGGHGMRARTPDANIHRRDFLYLCALASGTLAPGLAAGPAFAQAAPRKGGTLRVGFYLEASTMDPHLSGSKVDRQIYHNIYEPLLTLDVKLGIKPGLAESW